MAKETAEQRLLKLIEAADAKATVAAPPPAAAPVAAPAPAPAARQVLSSVSSVGVSSPPALEGLLGMFRRPGSSETPEDIGLKMANRLLVVVVIGIGVFFIADFTKGMKASKKEVNFAIPKSKPSKKQAAVRKQKPPEDGSIVRSIFDTEKDFQVDRSQAVPETDALDESGHNAELSDAMIPRDVAEYVAAVSRRNIFHPLEKKAEEELKVAAPSENQKIRERITNFKLVGVSWLDSAESATVMVEDQKTSVTHFLKTGDYLEGVKVETIYADRVVFSYQGETVTINL